MRLQIDGDIEVSINETVTVEIEATDTAFLAHTGPIHVGQWAEVTRPSMKEERHFKVTEAFSMNFSFTTGFDFSPDESGKIPSTAKYTIRISGDGPGGYVREREVNLTTMLPATRVFAFEVGQG